MKQFEAPLLSELRRLKDKLKNCHLDGFFLDRNTFLKADDAELVMVPHREYDGRVIEKPMVILKNVVEMTVDHKGRVVAVENKRRLGIWADAAERSLERFNK